MKTRRLPTMKEMVSWERAEFFRLLKINLEPLLEEIEMAKTPEAKVRDPSITYAHKLGIRTIRMYFGPGIQTGWPDDLYLIKGGRPLFIEMKAPGKVPTPKQEEKIELLVAAGYDVEWVDSVEDAKDCILHYFETAQRTAQ